MRYFALFLVLNSNKVAIEAMGSDSVFRLDGRTKLETMIEDSKLRMEKLKNVQPHYVGFRIISTTMNLTRGSIKILHTHLNKSLIL